MLHAAAMLIGTCALWLLATQRWSSSDDLTFAVASALACVFISARLGGVGGAFAQAPHMAALTLSRALPVLRAALKTVRTAAAADVTLKPALVRVKTRSAEPAASAAFASVVSATPGMAVVETDAEGALVHVLDEDEIAAEDLARFQDLIGRGRRLG
jgi:multisubunit Na+/H+ antiporter MnhE subunit